MNKICINTNSMIKYLEKFDYLEKKYGIKPKDEHNLNIIHSYERTEQRGRLQGMPPNYLDKTIEKVYSFSANKRLESARIFNIVRQEFINKFINVYGLDTLFNEHYFDFEWDMHWGVDFEKTKSNYYRDHFEHQIRNMYMMLVFLDEFDIISKFEDMYLDESLSKTTEYVSNRFKHFYNNAVISEQFKNVWDICAQEYYDQKVKSFIDNNNGSIKINDLKIFVCNLCFEYKKSNKDPLLKKINEIINIHFNNNVPEYVLNEDDVFSLTMKFIDFWKLKQNYSKKHSFRYILYSASIMAALFHDVSYPLCHFRKTQNRISDYIPSMNHFIHNNGIDYDRIISIIHPSLLCNIIEEKEIRKKLEINEDNDYDHGVYSAITFLLSFYESGRIHELSEEKQIAVELAALAIYYHNLDFDINNKDIHSKEFSYFRPILSQEPISYLLKICDELQEWDRRYFELSEKKEYSFCWKCFYPIIKYRTNTYFNYDWNYRYVCGCKGVEQYKSSAFAHRDMYIVTTCRKLNIYDNFEDIIVNIEYEPLKLLKMLEIDINYAKYRTKSLQKFKKILLRQCWGNSRDIVYNIDDFLIDYTMTANPIYLKAMIVQKYISTESCNLELYGSDISNAITSVLNNNFFVKVNRYWGQPNFDGVWEHEGNDVFSLESMDSLNKVIEDLVKKSVEEISIKIYKKIISSKKLRSKIELIILNDLSENLSQKIESNFLHFIELYGSSINDKNYLRKEIICSIKDFIIKNYMSLLFKYTSKFFNTLSSNNIEKQNILKQDIADFIMSIKSEKQEQYIEYIKNNNSKIYKSGYISTIKKTIKALFDESNKNYIVSCLLKETIALINTMLLQYSLNISNRRHVIEIYSEEVSDFFASKVEYHISDILGNNKNLEVYYNLKEMVISKVKEIYKNRYSVVLAEKAKEYSLILTDALLKFCIKEEFIASFRKKHPKGKKTPYLESYLDIISPKISFYNELSHLIAYSQLELFDMSENDFVNKFLNKATYSSMNNKEFSNVVKSILKDFHCILKNTINLHNGINTAEKEDIYIKKYDTSESVYSAIEKYCNPLNWYGNGDTFADFSIKNIDFHSDLFLFELLGQVE